MRRHASSGSPYEPAIGFSRAVRVDRHVFVAGTCAVWPDGHVDPDPAVQAERCFEIIGEALAEVGAALADVVRTRVFLREVIDAQAVAEVHGRHFGAIRPASSFIVVRGFLDPQWRVEIEAEALLSEARTG